MPWYRNTNDGYGDPGPFEAASKEAFADEMDDVFQTAALDAYAALVQSDPDCYESEEIYVAHKNHQYRKEFIAGLEEVRYFRACDGVAEACFEAPDVEAAIEQAKKEWDCADPKGDYDVEISEYADEYYDEEIGESFTITVTVE